MKISSPIVLLHVILFQFLHKLYYCNYNTYLRKLAQCDHFIQSHSSWHLQVHSISMHNYYSTFMYYRMYLLSLLWELLLGMIQSYRWNYKHGKVLSSYQRWWVLSQFLVIMRSCSWPDSGRSVGLLCAAWLLDEVCHNWSVQLPADGQELLQEETTCICCFLKCCQSIPNKSHRIHK